LSQPQANNQNSPNKPALGMQDTGFLDIVIRSVTKTFPVGSTQEFWNSMVKGSAPIQMMKKGLGDEMWREKDKLALAWLEETLPTLNRPLTSDAWLGVGVK
jgi:hypothetical protein